MANGALGVGPTSICVLALQTTEEIAAISYSQVLISGFIHCGSLYVDFWGLFWVFWGVLVIALF